MKRASAHLAIAGLLASLFLGSQARAQYNYPAGYGNYGWHGWGGGSSSGHTAAGMGAFAAGAGQGAANLGAGQVQNSQARATNAQTAMGVNDYLWQNQMRDSNLYYAHLARDAKDINTAQAGIKDRILNNPNEEDIANGDTLNALLREVMNPKVYARSLEIAQKPLRSDMIKRLPFESAAAGITYSLEQLTDPATVPPIYARPEFADVRKSLRATAAELRKETTTQRPPKSATIKKFTAGLNSAKAILDGLDNVSAADKFQADKYLKALYGLTKMIDSPAYDVYLAAVDTEPSAPLCEVIIFMHAFNLQFGPAKDAATREYYSMLYGSLSELRQAVNPPPYQGPPPGANGPPPGSQAMNFYGNMGYQHVMPAGPPPGTEAPR
jgi:hypothetical protein